MKDFKKLGDCVTSKIDDKTRVVAYTSKDVFLRLKQIALSHQTSVSEMLRAMIDDYLREYDYNQSQFSRA